MLLFTQFRQSVSSSYFCIIAQHSLSLLFLYPLSNGKNVFSLCVWDKFSHLCNNRWFHKLIVHSLPCNEQGHPELDQAACSEPYPTRPWMFPGMGHLPPLWATCASFTTLTTKKKILWKFFPCTEHITAPLSIVYRVQLNTATISEACSDKLQDELKMKLWPCSCEVWAVLNLFINKREQIMQLP